jgi:hypothetical protein
VSAIELSNVTLAFGGRAVLSNIAMAARKIYGVVPPPWVRLAAALMDRLLSAP